MQTKKLDRKERKARNKGLHTLRTTMLQKFRGSRKFFHVIQGGLENPPSIFLFPTFALFVAKSFWLRLCLAGPFMVESFFILDYHSLIPPTHAYQPPLSKRPIPAR